MQALEAMRLDTMFKIELKDIGGFAKHHGGHNPKEVLKKVLDSEVQGRRFRFLGIKDTEKATGGEKKGFKKQEKQGGKQKDNRWE